MICNPCTNLRCGSAFALFGFSIPDISAMFHRKMSRFPFLVSCDFSPFLIKERGRETNQSRNGEFSQLENKKVKMVVLRHVDVDTGFLLSPGGGWDLTVTSHTYPLDTFPGLTLYTKVSHVCLVWLMPRAIAARLCVFWLLVHFIACNKRIGPFFPSFAFLKELTGFSLLVLFSFTTCKFWIELENFYDVGYSGFSSIQDEPHGVIFA